MNDTVTKLMALADAYTQAFHKNMQETGNWYAYGRQRQALQDELTSLFTPLSDEQIECQISEKHFDSTYIRHASDEICLNWYRLGVRDGESMHGITGQSK